MQWAEQCAPADGCCVAAEACAAVRAAIRATSAAGASCNRKQRHDNEGSISAAE